MITCHIGAINDTLRTASFFTNNKGHAMPYIALLTLALFHCTQNLTAKTVFIETSPSCNTISADTPVVYSHKNLDIAREQALIICQTYALTSNRECLENIACGDEPPHFPESLCQIESNSEKFSVQSLDRQKAKKKVISLCKNALGTFYSACSRKAHCDFVAPPEQTEQTQQTALTCSTFSDRYPFAITEMTNDKEALRKKLLIKCTLFNDRTNFGECDQNFFCH